MNMFKHGASRADTLVRAGVMAASLAVISCFSAAATFAGDVEPVQTDSIAELAQAD